MKPKYNVTEVATLLHLWPKQRSKTIEKIWQRHDPTGYKKAKARQRAPLLPPQPVLNLPACDTLAQRAEQHEFIETQKKELIARVVVGPTPEAPPNAIRVETEAQREQVLKEIESETDDRIRQVNCNHGIKKEAVGLKQLALKYGWKVIGQQEWGVLDCGKFFLSGKIDGKLEDGTIIEIKYKKDIYPTIAKWDKMQLQTYLERWNASRGYLCQYKDEEVSCLLEDRNKRWWIANVREPLDLVTEEILALMSNEALQDAFLSK